MRQEDYETKLKQLMSVHLHENRNRWALEAKRQGKKVMGILDASFPEEVFHAAGMLSYHLVGTYKANTPMADAWRPPDLCRYCHHVLESLLSGELNFLDGIVHDDWDDDERRLYDLALFLGKPAFNYLIHVPRSSSELAYKWYATQLQTLIKRLEVTFNVRVSNDSLREAMELHNRMRKLLRQLYEWRKREVPPVSGAEAIGIVMAAFFMPKEQFVAELESLMDYLEQRKTTLEKIHPRLLMISDHMHLMDYLELVEGEGVLIAMDDLDSGSGYFWNPVEGGVADDPVYVLAKTQVSNPVAPCKWFWERQADQVIEWVKDYRIDGVLQMPHLGDANRLCCTPYMLERLRGLGVPAMSFTREYHLANVGQLKTRVSAFLETLKM